MTGWRRVAIAVGLAFALGWTSPGPAAAGPDLPPGVEETEYRLKTAGVDDALRARIHAAIAKGVRFLLDTQADDGALTAGLPRNTPYDVGSTALAGLALAHSGLPGSATGARRALDWLAPAGKAPRMKVTGGVYESGICALLLDALDARPELAGRIVAALTKAQHTGNGWWAYCTDDCTGCSWGKTGETVFNLSTTQFAALGLWAGERAGTGIDHERLETAWTLHLESLLARQLAEGDWPYMPEMGAANTLNHAAMGLANLELASAFLRDRLSEDVRLARRVQSARARALEELARDGLRLLDTKPVGGVLDVYGYYALEKACVFADVEHLDGRLWYVAGARRLLAVQRNDGSWTGQWSAFLRRSNRARSGDAVATAFALLFLLRVSETYRPTTPRDVPLEKPPVAITPRDGEAPSKPPGAPVLGRAPAGVPLADAVALNEELEAATGKRRIDPEEVRKIVTRVRDVQRRVVSDGPADDIDAELRFAEGRRRWRARLDTLLAHAFSRCDGPRRDAVEPVSVLIATTIGEGGAGAAARLLAKLPSTKRGRLDDLPSATRLDAAAVAVARAGAEDAIPFLVHLVTDGAERRDLRVTRAALHGLAASSAAPGDVRRDAVRLVLRRLASLEKAARTKDDDMRAEEEKLHWTLLEERAIDAVVHLATDPATGRPPDVDATDGRPTFRRLREWFDQHDDVRSPPWRDD